MVTVPQGVVGDRHLVTVPQGVVGDRLPWGGERQGGGGYVLTLYGSSPLVRRSCLIGGCLTITHVMWYYDTHLQHRKGQASTAVFAFVDHVPDMACKIATIEPDSLMYLLGVSIDRAADWVDQVKLKLKHALTHGGRLDECGDWDQQPTGSHVGFPFGVWMTSMVKLLAM